MNLSNIKVNRVISLDLLGTEKEENNLDLLLSAVCYFLINKENFYKKSKKLINF